MTKIGHVTNRLIVLFRTPTHFASENKSMSVRRACGFQNLVGTSLSESPITKFILGCQNARHTPNSANKILCHICDQYLLKRILGLKTQFILHSSQNVQNNLYDKVSSNTKFTIASKMNQNVYN